MSGRSFLRMLAGRLREALPSVGGGARRRALPGSAGQIVARGDLASGGWGSSRRGAQDIGPRLWGKSGPHGGPLGGGGQGARAHAEGSGRAQRAGGKSGHAVGDGDIVESEVVGGLGGEPKGRRGGGRRARRARGRKSNRGVWSSFLNRLRKMMKSRNWIEDIRMIGDRVEETERLQRLPGRIYDLGSKAYEGLVAAGSAIVIACIALSEKIQEGTTAAKDKVLQIKAAVKDCLSPSKAREAKEVEPITPHALDFSP